MAKFGKHIQAIRVSANKTLREVAETLGIAVSYLSDVEHGRKKPFPPELLHRFAVEFNADQRVLQNLAAEARESIEIPLRNQRLNDLAYALARSANSGETEELKNEIRRFLAASGDEEK